MAFGSNSETKILQTSGYSGEVCSCFINGDETSLNDCKTFKVMVGQLEREKRGFQLGNSIKEYPDFNY